MLKFALEILFPTKCGFCGKINKDGLCAKCLYKLKQIAKCKIESYEENDKFYFDYHVYLFEYKAKIRNILIDFKFNDKPYLGKSLIEFMIKNKKICGFLENYDIIIPVPMYRKNKNKRGYNQADLLAKCIAEKMKKIPNSKGVLEKTVETKKQSTLGKKQREQNLVNAYEIKNSYVIENKNIILVDDIFTTGSTANECSKMLKQAGAKKIVIVTIAKD